MIPALRRAAIFAAIILALCVTLLHAQDDSFAASAGKFSCDRGAAFIDDAQLAGSLAPLDAAPKDLPATAKPRIFGPFQPDGLSVEFYQFLTGGNGGYSAVTETDLNLYLHVFAAKEKGRWYEFRPQDPTISKADGPPVNRDADSNSNDQNANQAEAAAKPSDPAAIFTPDPALPLFQVSYGARWLGANAGGSYGHVLVLDLRSTPPRVAQQLECTQGEGGGVCTAPDSGYGFRATISCEWKQSDYVCNQRINLSTGWGERFDDSSYFLLSGKDAYQPPPEAVNRIEWIPDRMDRRKGDGQRFLVPDLGDTDEIFSLKQPNHELYLLAARGSSPALHMGMAEGNSFDERFFLAEHPFADRPSIAVELQTSTASTLTPITYPDADRMREQAAKPAPPTVTSRAGGPPISWKVKKIYGDDTFSVLQVTVKEGNVHAIYWVGIDQRDQHSGGPIVADLYRLSTDAQPYYQCNRFVQEQNAAAYHLVPGAAFHATIDVEPLHITDGNGGLDTVMDTPDLPPAKTCTKHMSWDRTKGFVFAENPVCTKSPARLIVISDDGVISTKPMPADATQ